MIEIIKTIGGIILFLVPFLLAFGFKDRRQGLLYILTADIAFHIAIALFTQAFHIFLYPIVLWINLALAIIVVLIILIKPKKFSHKPTSGIKQSWLVTAAFLIIFLNLWSVHNDYSGSVSTINGLMSVHSERYLYPYFSDEWSGVAYINYSIDQNSLPTVNPLINGSGQKNIPNVFVAFFSLLAELCLLLNIVPLTGYAVLALFSGLTICGLIYWLMRENGIAEFPALISALSLPYIINGANLPGLWFLIPFIGGMILFLLSLIALSRKELRLSLFSALIALLLYPPFIIFIFPIFLVWLLSDKTSDKIKKMKMASLVIIMICVVAAIIFLFQGYKAKDFLTLIISYLWRDSLDSGIASYPIWRIIPFWILPFALFGLFLTFKKKVYFLIAPLLTGLSFWLAYNYSTKFFIIDYARVVVISSWLMLVFAGFGFDYLLNEWEKTDSFLSKKIPRLLARIIVLILFLVAAYSYTERDAWKRLTLTAKTPSGIINLSPAPPANQYLTEKDLALFNAIPKKIRFLAPPWKSLVIGAATGHYPLNSKSSIITNNILNYNAFLAQDCADKIASAKKHDLKYIYSQPFNCPDFQLIDSSQNDLFLYKRQ